MADGEREQLWSLQYLRAIAAIIVVVGHAIQIVPIHGRGDWFRDFPIGGSGVDIFFVISGFIMCHIYTARPTSGLEFFKRRLARVGPAYWIVTLATSVAIVFAPALFRSSELTLPLFLASMAFIAWPNPGLGEAMPVFLVGWTLNYEFFFYGLFAVSIALWAARPWMIVGIVFALCWLAGWVIRPQDQVAQFYLHPMTAEFVAGIAVWRAYRRGLLRSPLLGWASLAIGIAGLVLVNQFVPIARADPARVLYWGVPGLFLVIGAIALDVSGRTPQSHLWKLLGDASYAIYLVHFLMLGFVRLFWGQFQMKAIFGDAILVLFAVIACLVASVIFHILIEKPASAWMRRALR